MGIKKLIAFQEIDENCFREPAEINKGMSGKGMLLSDCLPLWEREGVTLTDLLKFKKIVTGIFSSQNIINEKVNSIFLLTFYLSFSP